MNSKRICYCLFLLWSASLFADFKPENFWAKPVENQQKSDEDFTHEDGRSFFKQWFLGPLLVPSPVNASFAHPVIEPSVTANCIYGDYKNNWGIRTSGETVWSLVFDGYWQFGFPKYFGVDIITNLVTNYTKHSTYTHFSDTTVRFGYQISTDKRRKGDWTPNSRLIFQEIFPTGKFHKLRLKRGGIDATGQGSFQSGFYLAAEKGFNFDSRHAYNLYGAVGYILPANFKVKGANLYGGNDLTNGKIRPGSVFSVFLSGEVEVTKRIILAFDSNYQQSLTGSFTGNQGIGAPTFVPQIVTFNLAAPEVEIALTENAGFVVGPWYTLGGQNSVAFVAFFVAFLWVF